MIWAYGLDPLEHFYYDLLHSGEITFVTQTNKFLTSNGLPVVKGLLPSKFHLFEVT